MPEFIIDANLPFDLEIWKNENFVFVLKINPFWNDDEIWNYARLNNLVIVTKDKDFILKQVLDGSPPKIVHIKFGNLKLNDFIYRIQFVWNKVEVLLETHTIVNVYLTKVEAIK
jgi:predicted nuclease of predicted toxin-antitoxin system